jgi:hypothetical protein
LTNPPTGQAATNNLLDDKRGALAIGEVFVE